MTSSQLQTAQRLLAEWLKEYGHLPTVSQLIKHKKKQRDLPSLQKKSGSYGYKGKN